MVLSVISVLHCEGHSADGRVTSWHQYSSMHLFLMHTCTTRGAAWTAALQARRRDSAANIT